jgi:hypothetical protein
MLPLIKGNKQATPSVLLYYRSTSIEGNQWLISLKTENP